MHGGRVREGDLCAIKIVKALGHCTGREDTKEGLSSFFTDVLPEEITALNLTSTHKKDTDNIESQDSDSTCEL